MQDEGRAIGRWAAGAREALTREALLARACERTRGHMHRTPYLRITCIPPRTFVDAPTSRRSLRLPPFGNSLGPHHWMFPEASTPGISHPCLRRPVCTHEWCAAPCT
eukprot:351534-Chlamydomonas_euryale.AAC.5